MTTLALDLGTKTGWAILHDGELGNSGTWDLSPRRGDSPGRRFVLFRGRLREMLLAYPDIRHVVYEEVVGHAATYAAQMYGAFQGALMTWCHDASCSFEGVPVGTLKKWATGKGNANKAAMVFAVQEKTTLPITDHNHADAVLLALYAAEQEGGR